MLRYVRWQIESRLRREIEFQWIEGARLLARNGMTGATGNIYCGLHEFTDMAFLLHFLKSDDLFVDVGANIGSYTILASAVCGAETIAIEPDPNTMHFLKRNVEANKVLRRVQLVEAALGSRSGLAQLTVGQDSTNRVIDKADGTETQEVKLRPLDDILEGLHPVFIKIDVEGYEPEVIAGSSHSLGDPSLLAMLIETVDDAVRAKLEAVGFQQASYDPFTRSLSPFTRKPLSFGPQNSLFVRDIDLCRDRVTKAPYRSILGQSL